MAPDLTPAAEEPRLATEAPLAVRPRRPDERQGVYTGRFGFAYALLAAVVGLAVGGFVVLASRVDDSGGPQWSRWQPAGQRDERPREIAEHVSNRYRLPSGSQLVGVIPIQPASVQSVPISVYAIRKSFVAGDLKIEPAEGSLMYTLCGFGQRCSIAEGQASVERARLMHQEALELALYSFRYVDDVTSVVTLLPPRGEQNAPTFAMYFKREDLNAALEQPLRLTVPESRRLSPDRLSQTDLARISRLTRDKVFQYTIQQAPDGSPLLVFSPPSA